MSFLFSAYSIRHRHISQILRTRYLQRHGFCLKKVRFNCSSPLLRSCFNMAAFGLGAVHVLLFEKKCAWFTPSLVSALFSVLYANCFRGRRSDETQNGEKVLAYTGLFEFLGVDASPNNSCLILIVYIYVSLSYHFLEQLMVPVRSGDLSLGKWKIKIMMWNCQWITYFVMFCGILSATKACFKRRASAVLSWLVCSSTVARH